MDTLVIMAKHPVPGRAKTRLARSIGAGAAAHLATAFLKDLIDRLGDVADRRVLATWPDDAEADKFFRQRAGDRFGLWPQPAGSLGDRLVAAFADHLDRFGDRVVIIGSDSPTLPRDLIESSFVALQEHPVVLGPARDGGYYLVGQQQPVPGLFSEIDWSTSRVLAQTLSRLKAAGVSAQLLPEWYDIDSLEDLKTLAAELRHPVDSESLDRTDHTRRALASLETDWDTPSCMGSL